MAENVVTKVVRIGEESGSSSALFVVELDEAMHLGADGNVVRSFLPGEQVFVLLHHDPVVRVVRVADTANGDLQRLGTVSRSRTVQVVFPAADDAQDLPHNPDGLPSVVWYGRSSQLQLAGRALRAPGAPCLGDVTYVFTASQYRYRLPAGVTLAKGERFPVSLVIEVEV